MTARQRIAKVADGLNDLDTLYLIISEIDEAGMLGYGRRIAELTIAEAPISRIGDAAEARVRTAMKGKSRDEVDAAVRPAVEDGVFRFLLVMQVNESALVTFDRQTLLACAITFWMGALLGGPHSDDLETEDIAELEQAWARWRWAVAAATREMARDERARKLLEDRYLGGRSSFFQDTQAQLDSLRDQFDRLGRLSAVIPFGTDVEATLDPPALTSPEEEAVWLADRSRVRTFECFGDRASATAVLERHLLAAD